MLLPGLVALILAPQVAHLELDEEHRLGSADGPLEEVFGAVSDVAADTDGNVYVLDQRADRIRVFSGSGSYVRTFGQRGRGAGELSRPIQLDLGSEVLTVLNPSGIANAYAPTGRLLASGRVPFGAQEIARLGEGRYAVLVDGGISREGPRPVESVLLVEADGVDTLLTVPSRDILYRSPTATSAIGTSLCGPAHFVGDGEGELWVVSGVEGTLSEWRIGAGDPEPARFLEVAPRGASLSEAMREELRAQLPRQIDPEVGDLYLPSVLSSVCGLERSTDGTLWVRLADQGERERWRAIDADSLEPVAELVAPEGVAIRAFSGDRAYGIEVDGARVTRVVVYRIDRIE